MSPRQFALVAGGAALVATSAIAIAEKTAYNERSAQKLAKALAGRSPGNPVACISNNRGSEMQVIDDNTILFHESGTVYVQKPKGGCHGLGSGFSTLVTRLHSSTRLCNGQIGELVDRVSGFNTGSCVFGDFVPYRKAS